MLEWETIMCKLSVSVAKSAHGSKTRDCRTECGTQSRVFWFRWTCCSQTKGERRGKYMLEILVFVHDSQEMNISKILAVTTMRLPVSSIMFLVLSMTYSVVCSCLFWVQSNGERRGAHMCEIAVFMQEIHEMNISKILVSRPWFWMLDV